jgi:hypothetical protein
MSEPVERNYIENYFVRGRRRRRSSRKLFKLYIQKEYNIVRRIQAERLGRWVVMKL